MKWIIEPHSDDAYLSLHTHITTVWAGRKMTIVTVFGDRRRSDEAKKYATMVGCDHVALGFVEGGGLSKSAGTLPPFSSWGIQSRRGDTFVFPLGLQHPDHLAVVARIPDGLVGVTRYLDTPYYAKQKIRDEVQGRLEGSRIVSTVYASMTKFKHIAIFKSQGRYFFHHPPESIPRLELVVRTSDSPR